MVFQLQAIDRTKLYASIVEQILDGIESGAFPPGSALPAERILAARLGVSRSSVREAIRVLEHAGLLDVRTGSGTYVADPGPPKVAMLRAQAALKGEQSPIDVMAARRAVEPTCAGLGSGAAPRARRGRNPGEHRVAVATARRGRGCGSGRSRLPPRGCHRDPQSGASHARRAARRDHATLALVRPQARLSARSGGRRARRQGTPCGAGRDRAPRRLEGSASDGSTSRIGRTRPARAGRVNSRSVRWPDQFGSGRRLDSMITRKGVALGRIEPRGVIPAIPTPFTADGSQVDEDALRRVVRHVVDAGVHGIMTTGGTGEFPHLSRGRAPPRRRDRSPTRPPGRCRSSPVRRRARRSRQSP